jgi:hypothetical protein
MSALTRWAAWRCVAAGLIAGAVVAMAARDGREGLRVAPDFWLAARLLSLTAGEGWEPTLVAALILAVRRTAGLALRRPNVRPHELTRGPAELGPGDAR